MMSALSRGTARSYEGQCGERFISGVMSEVNFLPRCMNDSCTMTTSSALSATAGAPPPTLAVRMVSDLTMVATHGRDVRIENMD